MANYPGPGMPASKLKGSPGEASKLDLDPHKLHRELVRAKIARIDERAQFMSTDIELRELRNEVVHALDDINAALVALLRINTP